MNQTIYEFSAQTIQGETLSLDTLKEKTLLIVNTASKCGFTSQYQGLEELYQNYKDQGLVVIGFPCNQFGSQEPGDEKEIQSFCELRYKVSFPLFAKIEVNGANTHPLYNFLKKQCKGLMGSEAIKWNFTKFLVNKDGMPIKRFAPKDAPSAIAPYIEDLLNT